MAPFTFVACSELIQILGLRADDERELATILEQVPPDPAKVNVAIDCAVVSPTDGSGNQQWRIDTTSIPAQLVLEGALCARAQQSGLGRVDVLLGCPSVN